MAKAAAHLRNQSDSSRENGAWISALPGQRYLGCLTTSV